MEYLNNFVIALVITMIFITAVDIISPDNSMKKYIKFVLGLVLISVMINPIIEFFTKGEEGVIDTIKNYENMFYGNITSNSEEKNNDDRIKAFRENLNKNCDNLLKNQFSSKKFKSNIECNLDLEDMTYTIEKLEIGVEDNGIKLIDKVKININESEEAVSKKDKIENEDEIKEYLSDTFKIPEEKIFLYSMGG